MSVTLTGDNNYSGVYDTITVLGGANYGGHNDFDTTDSNEVFMFGNLQYKSTTITDKSYDGTGTDVTSGTYQSTATGSSNDTLHFHFTFHAGTPGGTSNFLTDGSPQDYASDATGATQNGYPTGDGDATYQSHSSDASWNSTYADWQSTQPTGTTYSDPVTIETGVTKNNGGTDHYITLNVEATAPGTPDTLTADHGGNKSLLGFSVDSDHIALDGVTEAQFEQYFTINASSHTSANNNTVNDTVISLGSWDNSTHTSEGNWSVDLYGVSVATLQANAASLGYSNDTKGLADYVYEHIA